MVAQAWVVKEQSISNPLAPACIASCAALQATSDSEDEAELFEAPPARRSAVLCKKCACCLCLHKLSTVAPCAAF